jgi:serine phosphatase RsbU (regulator of sigma subunit)
MHRQAIIDSLHENIGVPPEALGGWAERLVDALHSELSGQSGRFETVIYALLEEALAQPVFVDEFVKVVSILRYEILRLRPLCEIALELEHLFYVGLIAFGNAATNAQGREKLSLEIVIDAARSGFERIGTALSRATLHQALLTTLPDVRIHYASVSLIDEDAPELLVPFVIVIPGGASHVSECPFPLTQLVPEGFFTGERYSFMVLPLSFEGDFFGVMVLEYSTNETVFGLIRDHVSSALKGGQLHRAALRQSAQLERVEREQLEQEAKIAARIQTEILPRAQGFDGLEISAVMVPAADVGGDYYDIVPTANGGWLGIGDVTGHGLIAGIVMLMLQGMVSALVRQQPMAQPSEIVTTLNQALYENVRNRLGRDDHATLTLLRYDRDGTLTFSGAHEDIILVRARTNQIELCRPPGFWSGTLEDVAPITTDARTKLENDDLLVLYSDGVTEAMNEKGEQLGLNRLCAIVEASRGKSVTEISRSILEAIEHWQSRQLDDVTVLVARYHSSS